MLLLYIPIECSIIVEEQIALTRSNFWYRYLHALTICWFVVLILGVGNHLPVADEFTFLGLHSLYCMAFLIPPVWTGTHPNTLQQFPESIIHRIILISLKRIIEIILILLLPLIFLIGLASNMN